MLAFLGNLGPLELVVIVVIAVLIFGKDLPQAASKAYLQVRKLRDAVDDLRRESGIERELRDIERNVREAEWEARRMEAAADPGKKAIPRASAPKPPVEEIRPAPPVAPEPPPPPQPDGPSAPGPDEARPGPRDAAS